MEDRRKYYLPITPVNDHLLCRICERIVIDAVECISCEKLFCEQCVELRKKKNNKCPENCDGLFKTKQPHRIVKDELTKVAFYCSNKASGCNQDLYLHNITQHAEECQYTIEQCDCGWKGIKSNKKNHEKACPSMATKACPTCKQQIKLSKIMQHNCVLELTEQLQKVSEKFFEYKEHSEFSIIELKCQFNDQQSNIQELKNQQAVVIAEQSELKKGLVMLLELFHHSEKNFQELIEIQQSVPESNLQESPTLKCDNNHSLSFWLNPKGEQRKRKCSKCQKTEVNCRYYCKSCKKFWCLQCEEPEIISNQTGASFCPGQHRLQQKQGGFNRCSVCERRPQDMLRPICAYCDECDFVLCINCLQSKRYQGRTQQCPIQ